MGNKKKRRSDLIFHASRRFAQRYGEHLDISRYEDFVKKIQNNDAKFIFRQSRTKTHWVVEGKFACVYDSSKSAIVTFLPPDAVQRYLKSEKQDKQGKQE